MFEKIHGEIPNLSSAKSSVSSPRRSLIGVKRDLSLNEVICDNKQFFFLWGNKVDEIAVYEIHPA